MLEALLSSAQDPCVGGSEMHRKHDRGWVLAGLRKSRTRLAVEPYKVDQPYTLHLAGRVKR